MYQHEEVLKELSNEGLADWSERLRAACEVAWHPANHRDLPRWQRAYESLPAVAVGSVELSRDAVTARGVLPQEEYGRLLAALQAFHPWRKGPFNLFGIRIDSEWRSSMKWERLAPHVDLAGKSVLDVGCGNGYYGWRMLAAGARRVLGLDPFLLYAMQHAAIAKYLAGLPNYVLPSSDEVIPPQLRAFDVVFSMGVLYHRASPIEHLLSLAHALRHGGELVLETLVLDEFDPRVLVPEDRYAKMRNVWFIPSPPMLERWLRRTGFREIRVVDITQTKFDEQRTTPWMQFESLRDFVDPGDPNKTIEGYPAPTRAILTAVKA